MEELRDFSVLRSNIRNEDERARILSELLRNPDVHRLMKMQSIPNEVLQKHVYLFQRYTKEIEPCHGCRSLAECRQKQKGYHMNLRYDGIVQESIAACRYERERLAEEEHMERYLSCDFGPSLRSVKFEKIVLDGEPESYVDTVIRLNELCEQRKGVFLYGNMGVGKTYLAACAANRMASEGESVVFLHYPSFCDRVAVSALSGEYRKEADYCRHAGLAVFDDIGAEEVTERNRQLLLSILDSRMQKGLMTWFTGNGDLNSLKDHLRTVRGNESVSAADRIAERIRTLAEPVYLDGNDRRPLCTYE